MRAVRNFKPDPVEDDKVRLVLEAATKAASGGNSQPWAFIVVRGRERKLQVQKVISREWHKEMDVEIEGMPPKRRRMYQSAANLVDHTADVPVIILACLDLTKSGRDELKYASIYPSVQNLMTAAWSLGLGTCLTTHGCSPEHGENEVKEILSIPEHIKVAALVYLGYPEGALSPPKRRALAAFVHNEGW